MWIRSQRRNTLVNINFMRVINDGNYCLICGATTDGCDCELGVCVTLILYSTLAGERINNLEYQNEVLMNELEQKKKDLRAYKCMYRSSYEGFEETK